MIIKLSFNELYHLMNYHIKKYNYIVVVHSLFMTLDNV